MSERRFRCHTHLEFCPLLKLTRAIALLDLGLPPVPLPKARRRPSGETQITNFEWRKTVNSNFSAFHCRSAAVICSCPEYLSCASITVPKIGNVALGSWSVRSCTWLSLVGSRSAERAILARENAESGQKNP